MSEKKQDVILSKWKFIILNIYLLANLLYTEPEYPEANYKYDLSDVVEKKVKDEQINWS